MSGGAPPDLLGKDEVASSNLASSSKKKPRTPTGFRLSSFLRKTAPMTKWRPFGDRSGDFLLLGLFCKQIFQSCGGLAVALLQCVGVNVHCGGGLGVA